MRVSETLKLVPLVEPKDYGSAGVDFDSINMSFVHSVCVYLFFGAITGNSVLKFYSGATAAAKTTALDYSYRFASGDYKATDADGLGDLTAVTGSSGLTLTAATFDHRTVVVEIDNNAFDGAAWFTGELSSVATVLNAAAVGVCDARYRMHGQLSVI